MATSLPNLVDYLFEGIHKIKCTDCTSAVLNTQSLKIVLIEFKCYVAIKITKKTFDENLKKKFANTYKFANQDTNKFILLLRKGV